MESRFDFGKNWESYSELIDDERLKNAISQLQRLLGTDNLTGKSFIDIGCGSGLHSLAAAKMGAKQILAIDIDPFSVSTTKKVFKTLFPSFDITVLELDVFSLDFEIYGKYDFVYSWGVLHHTGNMAGAIDKAKSMCKENGTIALALYGKTRHCERWKKIKKWYVNAPEKKRALAVKAYIHLFRLYIALRGKRLSTHIKNYNKKRGMDFYHDVVDWVGGYPYESVSTKELLEIMGGDFELTYSKVNKRRSGIFGSGCDEYVFTKS